MPTSPAEPDRRAFLGILAATAAAASGCTAATPAPAAPAPSAPASAAADPNKALRDLVLSSDVEPAFAFRASPLGGEPR